MRKKFLPNLMGWVGKRVIVRKRKNKSAPKSHARQMYNFPEK